MAGIRYFSEQIAFALKSPRKSSAWIRRVIEDEGADLISLNYIFCSDGFLLTLNSSFLNHDTFTDIITFDYSQDNSAINGEIYISIERVTQNSGKFKTEFDSELHRVMVHGVLHLLGYGDKTTRQKTAMRKKEEAFLSLRK